MTVRPDGTNDFGQIAEIRQVYEKGELNNELFIEVADNKDLTLSVDAPRLNNGNESAVVLNEAGTLHFFRNGAGDQTLNIFQGSESYSGERSVLLLMKKAAENRHPKLP